MARAGKPAGCLATAELPKHRLRVLIMATLKIVDARVILGAGFTVRGKLRTPPILIILLLIAAMLIQETGYYCGPAVVQMALSYVAADLQSQDTLASEKETDPVEGVTYTDMVRVPFENRGFQEVYEGTSELEDLREANDNDYLPIVLMYFSTARLYQHYVLVIGYNSSGICVLDPWPQNSSQPEGRFTGANAFISNELLADLWACDPSHWGLVIPYSNALGEVPSWWQQH